ncbi:MAG: replicative DNA helicase [Oscillospiraceae bacterium]|jgi:replicative DNA helicase|nr:replicative DNA helicase [Oscillospiraceae bacterium]
MPDYPISPDSFQMPFSMEAEQAVLGSVLIDPACMSLVQVLLKPEHFYLPQHRAVFGVMVEIEAVGGKIDPLLVLDRLKRDEVYDEAGGRNYLFQMAQAVPSTANVESYARIVREKFYIRTLITVSQEIIQSASAEAESADMLLDSAEQRIYEIRQGRVQSGATRLRDIIINDVYDHWAKLQSDDAEQYKGFRTGFSELDQCLTGLNRSDLVLIGARPAMGKTSVALRLARQVAGQGRRVLFFTLEMTKEQVAQRVLSMEARVPGYKMRTGDYSAEEFTAIANAVGDLNDCELWFDDTSAITVPEIKARTRRLKGVDCVFIDYLGLIQGAKRSENRVQEVSEITRSLKMMAKDLNIPVVCCAQLSRASEGRGKSHRPQLSDLRESGSIEQDADVVLMLYREEYYKNEDKPDSAVVEVPDANTMEIIVAKNRHGYTKTIEFIWDGEHTLILPMDTEHQTPELGF